jgi:transcriptional regulator with GAF, ATPase, and Fis domain
MGIELPPLRERPDDILLFATRFLEDFNRSLGRNVRRISPEAQRLLITYRWPGNVRELKNVIERAMILSPGDELLAEHLPREIAGRPITAYSREPDPWERWLNLRPAGQVELEVTLGKIERHFVGWALEAANHNRARACELLGLTKVDQLRYLMRKYEIE